MSNVYDAESPIILFAVFLDNVYLDDQFEVIVHMIGAIHPEDHICCEYER